MRSGSESRTDLTPSPITATAEVGIGITREFMNHEDADRHPSYTLVNTGAATPFHLHNLNPLRYRLFRAPIGQSSQLTRGSVEARKRPMSLDIDAMWLIPFGNTDCF